MPSGQRLFPERPAQEQPHQPLLPNSAEPQLHLNREIMARFRPEMRQFYYDASKYDTYLEQLGVKYPQLVKP